MYPGYKPRDVLDEYAVTFFAMLNEGYRQRYAHYDMLASLSLLPNASPDAIKTFTRELKWASQRHDDILKTDSKSSSPEQIKRILGG